MPALPPALAFYLALTDAQRAKATLIPTDPDRALEQFPQDPRRGLALRELSPDLDQQIMPLLRTALSPFGARQARTIMDQPRGGYPNYHVAFYGEPTVRPFDKAGVEWRISGHHLTAFGFTDPWVPVRTGPLLLGADPPNLWYDEETALAHLQAALTGVSSATARRLAESGGAPIADLPQAAQQACRNWLDERLKAYAAPTVKAARRLHEKHGGWRDTHLHLEGDASRRCEQGGRYYAVLSGPSINMWTETRIGHLHLLLDIPGPKAKL